ncbi:MAG: hypothetical protein UHZ01_07245 [Prevotella sp.]|nr:hypothetical protein [Prevotella sp.]
MNQGAIRHEWRLHSARIRNQTILLRPKAVALSILSASHSRFSYDKVMTVAVAEWLMLSAIKRHIN